MIDSTFSGLRICAAFATLLLLFSVAAVVAASAVGEARWLDRGVIAYVSVCSARTDGLYQMDISHQIQMPLTSRYAAIYSLSYSPHGSWLVFEAVERSAQDSDRRVYAIDLQTHREYGLAPDYFSLNGTPIRWQAEGKYLELRLMGSAGTGMGMADIVVDVRDGEVIDAAPVSDAFRPMNTGDDASAAILIPVSGFDASDTLNNRVDSGSSARGDVARSRRNGIGFDLYIRYVGEENVIQITHDDCVERYPRWQP